MKSSQVLPPARLVLRVRLARLASRFLAERVRLLAAARVTALVLVIWRASWAVRERPAAEIPAGFVTCSAPSVFLMVIWSGAVRLPREIEPGMAAIREMSLPAAVVEPVKERTWPVLRSMPSRAVTVRAPMERLTPLAAVTLPAVATRLREPERAWVTEPRLMSPLLAVRATEPLPVLRLLTVSVAALVKAKLPALLLRERVVAPVPAWVTARELREARLTVGVSTLKMPPAWLSRLTLGALRVRAPKLLLVAPVTRTLRAPVALRVAVLAALREPAVRSRAAVLAAALRATLPPALITRGRVVERAEMVRLPGSRKRKLSMA